MHDRCAPLDAHNGTRRRRFVNMSRTPTCPVRCIAAGSSELRVKGEEGIYRAFYYTASAEGILVFHAFVKKTQRTPPGEVNLARKRLKELLDG